MSDKQKPSLNELFHLSGRKNRLIVGPGASRQDANAALRRLMDPDGQDELPTRRYVAGKHDALNVAIRRELRGQDDDPDEVV